MKKNKSSESFSPLLFLASLGAGGISIMPFVFFQYTLDHGSGLISLSHIDHIFFPLWLNFIYRLLEGVMVVFVLLHLGLSFVFLKKLFKFRKTVDYQKLLVDPLSNASVLAPFISIIMSMNVFIGPIRFFVTPFANYLQHFMLPALIVWMIIYVALLKTEIGLLTTTFVKGFDVSQINFGWLLHPFALGMLTVTGTGIAAMAKDANVAHLAAFLSFISGGMGFFLLLIKTNSLFQKHFASQNGLGDKKFLPGFLIVIPNITLYAISAFRIGHYLEAHHQAHMGVFFLLVTVGALAFETWYLIFGLSLLRDYFKKTHFAKEYFVTQWGLICPFVAYGVISSFVYKTFVPNPLFMVITIISLVISVYIFFDLFYRHLQCCLVKKPKIMCK